MESTDKNHNQIYKALESLKEAPERSRRVAAQSRSRFLSEAHAIQDRLSTSPLQRLYQKVGAILSIPTGMERSMMKTALAAMIVAIVVVIGGGGLTAYAAQGSLPDEFLYPVKLFMEDTQFNLTKDPLAQVQLLTQYANNRADEIAAMAGQGEDVPAMVMHQLQTTLQQMLQLAAGMDGETAAQALQQIRSNLRTQAQLMTMLGMPEDVEPALEQLFAMLQNQHRITSEGSEEPLKFQQMYNYNRNETPGTPPEETNGNQYMNCAETEDCTPMGDANQNGEENGNGGESGPPDDIPGPNEDPGCENGCNAAGGEPGGPADTGNNGGNDDPGSGEPGNTDPGGGSDDSGGNGSGGNDDSGGDGGNGSGGNGGGSGNGSGGNGGGSGNSSGGNASSNGK